MTFESYVSEQQKTRLIWDRLTMVCRELEINLSCNKAISYTILMYSGGETLPDRLSIERKERKQFTDYHD